MHLTVVWKQSGSQLGTGKYFLVLSGLKYNAEDSHGAIEIKGQLYESFTWPFCDALIFLCSVSHDLVSRVVWSGLVSDRVLVQP